MTFWDILSVLGSLVGFVLILVLAWWTARAIGQGQIASGGSHAIQVVDRLPLGGEKQLLVVRAAGRVLLLGVTAHHVEFLQELDEEDLPPPGETAGGGQFLAAFRNALDAKKGRETGDGRDGSAQGE